MAKRNAFAERVVIDCLIGHFVGDICAREGRQEGVVAVEYNLST